MTIKVNQLVHLAKSSAAENSGKMYGYYIVSWLDLFRGYNYYFIVAAHGQLPKCNQKEDCNCALKAHVKSHEDLKETQTFVKNCSRKKLFSNVSQTSSKKNLCRGPF